MKAFVSACVVLAAISYGAHYYLNHEAGFSAADQTSGPAVRLD